MNRFDSPPAPRPTTATVGPKTYAIVLGTLVLGMLLGAVVTGFVARQTAQAGVPEMMIGHDSLESAFLDLIQPTDAQIEAIYPVLQGAQEGMVGNLVFMRCRMRTHIDSIVVQLDEHLSPEQMERIRFAMQEQPNEEFIRRMPPDVMTLIRAIEAMDRSADETCVYEAPRIPLRRPGSP